MKTDRHHITMGVFLHVTVRYWHNGHPTVDPGPVLDGIATAGIRARLGRLAAAAGPFVRIETEARALTGNGSAPKEVAHLLPGTLPQNLLDRVNALAGEFARAKAAFLARYARTRAAVLRQCRGRERHRLLVMFPEVACARRAFEFRVRIKRFAVRGPLQRKQRKETPCRS